MIVMMAGDASSLELWSAKSQQQVIKLVKKGDFKIKCFDAKDGYIAYTDAQDTQIFHFAHDSLILRKISTSIC